MSYSGSRPCCVRRCDNQGVTQARRAFITNKGSVVFLSWAEPEYLIVQGPQKGARGKDKANDYLPVNQAFPAVVTVLLPQKICYITAS